MNRKEFIARHSTLAVVCLFAFLFLLAARSFCQTPALNKLYDEIITQCKEGRYRHAAPLAEKAVAVAIEAFGPDDTNVARYSCILATLHHHAQQYKKAELLYSRAREIWEQGGETRGLAYAECLNNLAELYKVQARYDEAEWMHESALSVRENALPPTHRLVVESMNNLAEVYRIQGKYAQSEALFARGLKEAEKNGTNAPCVATILNNLAFLYRDQGRYAKAMPLYTRALKIRESRRGRNHVDVAATMNDLAILEEDRGNYYKAEQAYLSALAVYTNVFGPDSKRVATLLKNLAGLYKTQGRHCEAEAMYLKALSIREKVFGTDHAAVASLLNDLAAFYRVQEKYAPAESLYRRALALRVKALGAGHPIVTQTRNNLARLYSYQERFSDAEKLYKEALDAFERNALTNHPDMAVCLNNLGELYSTQSNYAAARQSFHRALRIWESNVGTNHPRVATILQNLADLLANSRQLDKAENLYLRALAIRAKALGPHHAKTAETLEHLADLYARQGDHVRAAEHYERALRGLESASGSAGGEAFSGKLRTDQGDICSDYLAALGVQQEDKSAVEKTPRNRAFWAMELCRSRQFLDQLLVASAGRLGGLSVEDAAREDDIRFRMRALGAKMKAEKLNPSSEKTKNILARLERQMGDLRARERSLAREFARKYPRYTELRVPSPIALDEVQSDVLQFGEMLISYWLGQTHLFACVTDKSGSRFIAHPVDSGALVRRINDLRKVLDPTAGLSDCETYKQPAYTLYKELVAPFIKDTDFSQIQMLYIVPHGPLCAVAFESLITSTNGTAFSELDYLFLTIPTAYVPSARVLRAIRRDEAAGRFARAARSTAVLFGDPVYTEEQATSKAGKRAAKTKAGAGRQVARVRSVLNDDDLALIVPLPNTRKEVQTISDVLSGENKDVRVYLGNDAREGLIKELSASGELQSNRYVHFATHGILPGEVAGLSEPCLVMSIYGDDQEDGLLTMSEIFGLRLDANMVVLSACQTGSAAGDDSRQGLSGLARAFFFAGTPSVTAALWSLEDQSTMEFMSTYYQGLEKSGEDATALAALGDARKVLLNSGKFGHPFYWSGLVLFGEWR